MWFMSDLAKRGRSAFNKHLMWNGAFIYMTAPIKRYDHFITVLFLNHSEIDKVCFGVCPRKQIKTSAGLYLTLF